MSRPTQAVIHLDALRHNFRIMRQLTREARVVGIVKGDAYGHGAVRIAQVLEKEGIEALGVACIEEAIELRCHGLVCPIVLLEGFFTVDELPLMEQYHLIPMLHHKDQVDVFLNYKTTYRFQIWLKIDTGMHRLGFPIETFFSEYQRLRESPLVECVVLASHFACADLSNSCEMQHQLQCIKRWIIPLAAPKSLCNSAAILNAHHVVLRDDWVRPGIMLMGLSPCADSQPNALNLKPVMELTAQIIAVHTVPPGDSIGYGAMMTATTEMRVGTVSIGYGDGYIQQPRSGLSVLVHGQRVHVLGRVSMDLLNIDLTNVDCADVGTSVTLWDASLLANEVANYGHVTVTALLTGVRRIKKIYRA